MNSNNIYCMRCKQKTSNTNVMMEGNRIKCNCQDCGSKKSCFAKRSEVSGNGFDLVKTLNKTFPGEKHMRSIKNPLKAHSFTGPGTDLDKRLNPDNTWKDWSKPINLVDHGSYIHDLAYTEASKLGDKNKELQMKLAADKVLLGKMNRILKNDQASWSEKAEAKLVASIMRKKIKLGVGVE